MPRFLLDANLSILTAQYIRQLGHEVITTEELGLATADDKRIVSFAAENNYILITFDLDFGYLFHFFIEQQVGIIVLRLRDQTVESANLAVRRLLKSGTLDQLENTQALIVVDETTIRIHK